MLSKAVDSITDADTCAHSVRRSQDGGEVRLEKIIFLKFSRCMTRCSVHDPSKPNLRPPNTHTHTHASKPSHELIEVRESRELLAVCAW